MSEEVKPKHQGLSYSSFAEFFTCNRKWFLKRVLKLPIDSDASEDTLAFNVGKAFHKCLEDTRHDLNGYKFEDVSNTCKLFGLEDEDTAAMIYAMLFKYKMIHERSKLKVVACETVVETPVFYGIIDAIMYEDNVGFWIVDLKTAGQWYSSNINTAASHTQLNVYARYAHLIAEAVGLKDVPFLGCRLRTTVKSKIKRQSKESLPEYIQRMIHGIRSFDIAIPDGVMPVANISKIHEITASKVLSAKLEDEENFPPNFNSCMAFNKPCEHYSKCHGRNFSDIPKLEVTEV